MDINERYLENIVILAVSGRLDAASSQILQKSFEKNVGQISPLLIIDMREVIFIDSTGLSLLVQYMKLCRERKGKLAIFGIRQSVRIIFELTRLDKVFNIFLTEEEALKGIISQNDTP